MAGLHHIGGAATSVAEAVMSAAVTRWIGEARSFPPRHASAMLLDKVKTVEAAIVGLTRDGPTPNHLRGVSYEHLDELRHRLMRAAALQLEAA